MGLNYPTRLCLELRTLSVPKRPLFAFVRSVLVQFICFLRMYNCIYSLTHKYSGSFYCCVMISPFFVCAHSGVYDFNVEINEIQTCTIHIFYFSRKWHTN